jgi:hypothetical protein
MPFLLRNERERDRREALAKAVQMLGAPYRELPANWRTMDRPDKIEWLLGISLDFAAEVLCVPVAAMDQGMLVAADRVRHDLWTIALKMGLQDRRAKERAEALREMARQVAEHRE